MMAVRSFRDKNRGSKIHCDALRTTKRGFEKFRDITRDDEAYL